MSGSFEAERSPNGLKSNGSIVRMAVIDEFLTSVCYRPKLSLEAESSVLRDRTTAELRLAVI